MIRSLPYGYYLVFAITFGVHIAGDAYYLGTFLPYLQVVVPLAAFFILWLFFERALTLNLDISIKEVIFFLCFIAIGLGLSLFSEGSLISASNLILWGIAFMIWPCRKYLVLDTASRQLVAWAGFLLGLVIYYVSPELVNLNVLSLGGIWIWIQTLKNPQIIYLWVLSIIFWTLLWFTHQFFFLLLAFGIWFFLKAWTNRTQKLFDFSQWMIGLIILATFILIEFTFVFWDFHWWGDIFSIWTADILQIFTGIGDRHFYHYFAQENILALNPASWALPQSDFLLVLFEKGIVGLLAQLGLISFPLWFQKNNRFLKVCLLLTVFIFSSQIYGESSGILLVGMILFSE